VAGVFQKEDRLFDVDAPTREKRPSVEIEIRIGEVDRQLSGGVVDGGAEEQGMLAAEKHLGTADMPCSLQVNALLTQTDVDDVAEWIQYGEHPFVFEDPKPLFSSQRAREDVVVAFEV